MDEIPELRSPSAGLTAEPHTERCRLLEGETLRLATEPEPWELEAELWRPVVEQWRPVAEPWKLMAVSPGLVTQELRCVAEKL